MLCHLDPRRILRPASCMDDAEPLHLCRWMTIDPGKPEIGFLYFNVHKTVSSNWCSRAAHASCHHCQSKPEHDHSIPSHNARPWHSAVTLDVESNQPRGQLATKGCLRKPAECSPRVLCNGRSGCVTVVVWADTQQSAVTLHQSQSYDTLPDKRPLLLGPHAHWRPLTHRFRFWPFRLLSTTAQGLLVNVV